MTMTNIKTKIEIELEMELEAIRNGERVLGVSNQFDETVIESALENLTEETVEEVMKSFYGRSTPSIMTIAHTLSKFKQPEVSSVWSD